MKDSKQTRKQRALDLKAFLARNSHKFTFKEVCEEAGLKYVSTSNALGLLIRKDRTEAISDEKLDSLEETAIRLSERNLQSATA